MKSPWHLSHEGHDAALDQGAKLAVNDCLTMELSLYTASRDLGHLKLHGYQNKKQDDTAP